ncbi:MAG: septal ring lytic transglycosylase RlpA family protein [Bdellovibrionaceae bacterium]|nr:septal ring lytic transglycosylase RlpA family protein [Pseudobdellovibrionaceae bacterium]MBX3032445.1 septal ring lytic transglycosylase RlpA family protein [Pseudobdellovibrionaceae bacterium]
MKHRHFFIAACFLLLSHNALAFDFGEGNSSRRKAPSAGPRCASEDRTQRSYQDLRSVLEHCQKKGLKAEKQDTAESSPRKKSACREIAGGASWYGPGFAGRRTASGEIFNPSEMTAAHKTLPLGTKVKVTYEGKSVVVRINDRGPYVNGRVLDLSKAAAQKLGLVQDGHGRVQASTCF